MPSLISQAQTQLKRTAVVDGNKNYTYQNLLATSHEVASALLAEQSDLGEARIAFMIPSGVDYVNVQWGIWRAGGIAVPLCTLHPLPSIQYVLGDTAAEVLVVSSEYESFLAPLAKELDIRLLCLSELTKFTELAELPMVNAERRAMILYTSGTTSLPKGVVSTHANIESQITTLIKAWDWQKEDHILCVLPLHHVHGIINVMSCALWVGARVEFLPKFSTASVFEIFLKGQVNLFMAVPTIYYKLIAHWESQNTDWQEKVSDVLTKFRLMVSGSAALPISVLEKWRQISQHTLLERYGMTEIGMAVSNDYHGERIPGHIGRPLPAVQLRLVDESGQRVEDGQAGEIQIKGPSVFKEYWNKPEKTIEAFTKDAWFKTGDIALLNEQGYYRILGRNSVDIIKSGGYKISALEIEEILRQYPQISDCGVVGVPDEEWGEIIVAVLVPEEEKVDVEQLQIWLKSRMPAYRLPRKYLMVKDLPRNTLGKVTKNDIKELFA